MTCLNCESENVTLEFAVSPSEVHLFCCKECMTQFRKRNYITSIDDNITLIDMDLKKLIVDENTILFRKHLQLSKWMFLALREQNRPKFVQFHTHFMKGNHIMIEKAEELHEGNYLDVCNSVKEEIETFASFLKSYDLLY